MAANGAATNGVSHAQLDKQLNADSKNGRVAVHTFDQNDSPAKKAAAAGQGRDQLKSVKNSENTEHGNSLTSFLWLFSLCYHLSRSAYRHRSLECCADYYSSRY